MSQQGDRVTLDGRGSLVAAFTIQGNNLEIKSTIIKYVAAGIQTASTEENKFLFCSKLISNSLFSISEGSGIILTDTFATLMWYNRVNCTANRYTC